MKLRLILCALFALAFAGPAHAACYGDAQGTNASCTNVPSYLHSGTAQAVDDSGHGLPTVVSPSNAAGGYVPATIGTTDSVICTAHCAKVFLDTINDSAAATICLNLGATATITGTTCAAGEITLPPLWHRSWESNFVPADAVHAIASAAATPASVGAQ